MDFEMERSRQGVLTRLDQWYVKRFDKGFTPELQTRIKNSLLEIIEQEDLPEDMRKSISEAFLESRKIVGKSFSLGYHNLERFSSLYEMGHSDIPNRLKQEYLQPLFDGFKRLHSFVDGTRAIAEEKFPDELTDADIEKAFLKTYGNWRGYAENIKSWIGSAGLTLELLHMRKELGDEEYNISLKKKKKKI